MPYETLKLLMEQGLYKVPVLSATASLAQIRLAQGVPRAGIMYCEPTSTQEWPSSDQPWLHQSLFSVDKVRIRCNYVKNGSCRALPPQASASADRAVACGPSEQMAQHVTPRRPVLTYTLNRDWRKGRVALKLLMEQGLYKVPVLSATASLAQIRLA